MKNFRGYLKANSPVGVHPGPRKISLQQWLVSSCHDMFQYSSQNPSYRVSGRSVIHKLNFRKWPGIIETARMMGLQQISFLPADVSSHAFNREVLWSDQRQHEILPGEEELRELRSTLNNLYTVYSSEFQNRFIAEPPAKLENIYRYYSAFYGHNPFPYKKCNAPWVSTVIEADGTVKPCFFHPGFGNIRERSLESIINSKPALQFRKSLDMETDPVCKKCVCYLNLSPGTKLN